MQQFDAVLPSLRAEFNVKGTFMDAMFLGLAAVLVAALVGLIALCDGLGNQP